MANWCSLSPKDILLSGSGNIISGFMDSPPIVSRLTAKARQYYSNNSGVAFEDFAFPFLSAFAVHENLVKNQSQFTSMGQVLEFLTSVEGRNIPALLLAMRFYNSIIAAGFAGLDSESAIAERVNGAFANGELLSYPQDIPALQQNITKLPGIIRFLIDKEEVQNKSFLQYLRRGTAPEISGKIFWQEKNKKKYGSTSATAFMLEEYYLKNRPDFSAYKASDNVLAEVLEIIYMGMLQAEQETIRASEEHMQVFTQKIRDKFGVSISLRQEPYLKYEQKRFELQLLETLERLAVRMEKLLTGKGWAEDFHTKAIDPAQPLPPQIEERVRIEIERMKGRLGRALDKDMQQAIGITHYIWRSQDDDKVRSQHAAYDDQMFAWDSPPSGGHPGEAFGCRCYAEPVLDEATKEKLIEFSINALLLILPKQIALIGKVAQMLRRAGGKIPNIPGITKPVNIFERPKNVPEDWIRVPAKRGEGIKYVDPKNPHTYVRISRGKPNSSNPGQKVDYVRWQRNGQSLDKNGNVVPKESLESHIPLQDFNFK